MNPTYFALEGIIGAGKSSVMGWMNEILETDGYKFHLIPEPIEKFKCWKTYDPLVECYKQPEQSAALAQMHMMNVSLNYYSQSVLTSKRSDYDVVLSERSIFSPLVFTDTYFRDGTFSAFTKDSLISMWEEQMRDRVNMLDVKPDVFIYLESHPYTCAKRVGDDESPMRSSSERKKASGKFLEVQDAAYTSFFANSSIPVQKVKISAFDTARDAALRVCSIIRQEMCAEGGIAQAQVGLSGDTTCAEAVEEQLY